MTSSVLSRVRESLPHVNEPEVICTTIDIADLRALLELADRAAQAVEGRLCEAESPQADRLRAAVRKVTADE